MVTMGETATCQVIGYARVSTGHQSLDGQLDMLKSAGVSDDRIYSDKLSGAGKRGDRPGLTALLGYVRTGDTIMVVGIDRLGRDCAEVMQTVKTLRERDIRIVSLREGIDTSNATGRMIAGVFASLAELELELQRERKAAAKAARKARGLDIGRPKALTSSQVRQARSLRDAGEPVPMIAETLKVSRATVYRVLKDGVS